VTICVAGIYQDRRDSFIITACDKKVSMLGGWFSAEDAATKLIRIHPDWVAMISGELSPMVPIVDLIKQKILNIQEITPRPFALVCSDAYREERKHIIENEVLVDFEIDSYTDFRALRSSNRELFDEIAKKIQEREEGWSLLIAGFDKDGQPHLFVISERGKIQYCDITGFAAIGSGQWRALVELSTFRFNRHLSLTEATYGVMTAKYAAESASGVGESTIIAFLKPKQKGFVEFPEDEELDFRWNYWKNLPRIPEGYERDIESGLKKVRKLLKPLVSETSEPKP